jgi:hypothetical protein
LEHLIGYIGTWSAVKHYEKKNGRDPIDLVHDALKAGWGTDKMIKGRFPILLRVAKIEKQLG